jgi:hypothetical protein
LEVNMAGKLIDPRPPQWERKQPVDDVKEDRVAVLAKALIVCLTEEMDPIPVQLAALTLAKRATIGIYQIAMGSADAKVAVLQAEAMAAAFIINGVDVEL